VLSLGIEIVAPVADLSNTMPPLVLTPFGSHVGVCTVADNDVDANNNIPGSLLSLYGW
jgi:hypothetical protein